MMKDRKKVKPVKAWAIIDRTDAENVYRVLGDHGERYVCFRTKKACVAYMVQFSQWHEDWRPTRVTIHVTPHQPKPKRRRSK